MHPRLLFQLSIIAQTHTISNFYLYEDKCQSDVLYLSLGWTTTNTKTQPVPWALKALSNNGLKHPHSAGSNMRFVVSARSLAQLLEGEQMCTSPWINYESTANHPITLPASNVSRCRQSFVCINIYTFLLCTSTTVELKKNQQPKTDREKEYVCRSTCCTWIELI